MAIDYQELLQKAYLTPEQLASPLTKRDPIQTERTTFGQYGIYNDAPILDAAKAEALTQPGEVFADFSHSRGNYTKDLGWSSNSASGKLARGAAAFGVQAIPERFRQDPESGSYLGLLGTPEEPMGYSYTGLEEVAKRFGLDSSQFTPYEKEVKGERITDAESNTKAKGVLIRGDIDTPDRPLTRTVTAEEQMYEKLNELSKDYFAYTGDTTIPGQAFEGGAQSFQTALYQKQGDKLIAITPPQAHGGMQNADVYTGGGGFKLGELLRGVAPIALMAVGAPFLDAALAAGSAGAAAGSAGGAAGAAGAGSLEAYMLAAGLNPGTFSGAAFALPSALSVAPEVASALNTANATLPTIPGSVPYTPSAFGTLTPPLTGSGAVPGAMSTAIPGTGLTGALPAVVLVGDGTLGTTIGATYMASGPGQFATNILGNAIPASSIGIGGFAPASGLSIGIKDALNAARLGKGLLGGDAAQPTQQGAMQRPQSTMPQGQVDYSGILNLLQVPSPQRNMYSLLG
jgi:hypothetical protein